MQNSNVPAKLDKIWAYLAGAGYIRTIPDASQIGIADGAASYADGFPPLTAKLVAAGGKPPDIRDVNGALQPLSAWSRWVAAGGPITYDASFSAAIGGYPKGAFIQSATTPGFVWFCTLDNNTSNPDSGGAGWEGSVVAELGFEPISAVYLAAQIALIPLSGRLLNVHVFNTPGTINYVPVGGAKTAIAAVIGGGGGGGYCQAMSTSQTVSGGGGGAGAFVVNIFPVTGALSGSVGAPGAPFAAGGQSNLSIMLAQGGQPPLASTTFTPGGIGGSAFNGNIINANGGWGSDGQSSNIFLMPGNGAPGPFGGGGRAGSQMGENATAPGAGGGGAYDSLLTGNLFAGGSGGPGLIIVAEFS